MTNIPEIQNTEPFEATMVTGIPGNVTGTIPEIPVPLLHGPV